MTFAVSALPAARRPITTLVAIAVSVALVLLAAAAPSVSAAESQRIEFLAESDDSGTSEGSMSSVTRIVGAPSFWSLGYTGSGVDVAVIDSGVTRVAGLDGSGKVVHGPDVSYESGNPKLRNLDSFGHGTHMAGIIAGRGDGFRGVAPGARVISLKAADALGSTDTRQIIAAIKWVVEHRTSDGLNIRVLNLSFGATPIKPYQKSELAYAVEQAWDAGIVVVASAGNGGAGASGLSDPAFDPFVISVGSDTTRATVDVADDTVSGFSSRGDGRRDPDVVAPGKGVASLRVPGSHLDRTYPDARAGELFRGSGTSQAAAVVSGAAALIINQRPRIAPDQVKQLLLSTARQLPDAPRSAQGAGLIDLRAAVSTATSGATQAWERSSGGDRSSWTSANAEGNSWSQASPDGNSWSGNSWSGTCWTGGGWGGAATPDGNSWSSVEWMGVSWGKKPRGGGKGK